MKRILLLFLSLSLLMNLVGCRRASGAASAEAEPAVTLLFAGLDEAGENTDVLMLVSIDPACGHLSLLQIPRDTYCRVQGRDGKLNEIYASARFAGKTEAEALSLLKAEIGRIFSFQADGAIAVRSHAIAAAADALGGVTVTIPEAIEIEGRVYEKGEHTLSGAQAEAFVRYREGYLMGDLGRVDAQKLFLSGLLRRLRESSRPAQLIKMLFSMKGDVVTDLSLSRALSIGLWAHARLHSLKAAFITLPGEALLYGGHWYYIANRACTEAVLRSYFSETAVFDAARLLVDDGSPMQKSIYDAERVPYKIYTEEDISSLEIKTKKE